MRRRDFIKGISVWGRMAAGGARAAGDNAADWFSQQSITQRV
jgi:hypothetical protein